MLKKILVTVLSLFVVVCNAEIYVGGNADVTNGLIAHWKLDETSYNGTAGEVRDSSESSYDGTTAGKVFTNPGKIDRAGYFDGTGYISLPNTISVAYPCSLSMWFKTSEPTRTIMAKYNNSGVFTYAIVIFGGSIYGGFNVAAGYGSAPTSVISVPGGWNDDNWHFVAMTAQSDGTVTLSVDASSMSTGAFQTPEDIQLFGHFLGLGAPGEEYIDNFTGNNDRFSGLIDDFRIYNRAITPEEVTRLYKLGNDKIKESVVYSSKNVPYENLPTNGLIAHWKLDELSYNGTAGEVKDSSGNGKHGISYKKVITNPGQIKRAAYFDGSGASVYRGDIYLPTNNTMSGWVKIPRLVNGSMLFGYESGGWPQCVFSVNVEPNLLLFKRRDYVSNPEAVNGGQLNISDGIDTNAWYFLAVTSTNFISTVYLNGIDVGFVNYETYEFALTYLSLGSFLDWNWKAGESIVDDVRIYNRALSASEVKALYEARPVEENVAVVYDGETLISNPLKKDYAKSAWNPMMLSNCVLWLDAADKSTFVLDSSGRVNTWINKADPTVNAAWPDEGWKKWLYSGRAVYAKDDGEQLPYYSLVGKFAGKNSGTAICYFRPLEDGGFSVFHSGDNWTRYFNGLSYPNTFRDSRIETLNLGIGINGNMIYSVRSNTSIPIYKIDFNNALVYSSSDSFSFTPSTATVPHDVASQSANSTGGELTGFVYEQIIYTRDLSDEELQQVNNYLIKKWKIKF